MSPRPLRYFPIAFGSYADSGFEPLDVDPEVDAVGALLAGFGARTDEWTTPAAQRDSNATSARLQALHELAEPADTFVYWLGHGWSNNLKAELAKADSTPGGTATGVSPSTLADLITSLQRHPYAAGACAVVVVDACRAGAFTRLLGKDLMDQLPEVGRVVVIGVSGQNAGWLGDFREALRQVLDDAYRASDIRLDTLPGEIKRLLPDAWGGVINVGADDVLVRRAAVPSGVTLDVFAEVKAAIDRLGPDEQAHFIPKAQGGEFGEIAWYFEGRDEERNAAVRWLRAADSGMLVVTGPAGSGKSALLGHLVEQSRPGLRQVLVDTGMADQVGEPDRPPDDVFDSVIHLTGRTAGDLVVQLGHDLHVPAVTGDGPQRGSAAFLVASLRLRPGARTVLIDALDEAQQPELVAREVIRPLSTVPGTRVVVGTRASTLEGPDHPAPESQDLLDALGTATYLRVNADTTAVTRYVTKRLRAKVDATPELTRRTAEVGELIGAQRRQFLYARLAVHELLAGALLDTDAVATLISRDHRDLFAAAVARLTAANPAFGPLLHALGLARGRGLPLVDGIWAAVATAVSPGIRITNSDASALLDAARPYITVDVDQGDTVYRLAHATFAEYYPDTEADHQRVHQALLAVAAADPRENLNAYIRQYLPAHAGLAGLAAWHDLADHPWVLDRVAPTAVAANAMRWLFGRHVVPARIRAVAGAHHILQRLSPSDRLGNRQLAEARFAGTSRPAARPPGHARPGRWSVNWAALTQAPLHLTLSRDRQPIRALSAVHTRDGRSLLAVGSEAGEIELWDPVESKQVGVPLHPVFGAPMITAMVAFAAASGDPLLAVAYKSGELLIWDVMAATVHHRLVDEDNPGVHSRAVIAFTFPDGHTEIIAGYHDGTLLRWDPFTGRLVHRIQPVEDAEHVHSLAAWTSESGIPLVAVGDQRTGVHLRHLGTDGTQPARAATTHRQWVNRLPMHTFVRPGVRRVLAHANSYAVHLRDGDTLDLVGEPLRHGSRVWAITSVPDSDGNVLLATGGRDHAIRLWSAVSGRPVGGPLIGHNGGVRALAAFPGPHGGYMLASASDDDTVRIWDLAGLHDDADDSPAVSPPDSVTSLVSPAGDHRVVTAGTNHGVRMWNPNARNPARSAVVVRGVDSPVLRTTAWPDGRDLLLLREKKLGLHVWDPFPQRQNDFDTLRLPMPAREVDHWLFASGAANGEVGLWHPAGADPIAQIDRARAATAISALDTADGPLVFLGHADGTVHRWAPGDATTDEVASCPGRVTSIAAFTGTDGTELVATVTGGVLRVLDAHSNELITVLPTDSDALVAHAVTGPEGTVLAVGTAGGTLVTWAVSTWEMIAGPVRAHSGRVFALTDSAQSDEVLLVSSGRDGVVGLWNPMTGAPFSSFTTGAAPAHSLAAIEGDDGEPLVATAIGNGVRTWTRGGNLVATRKPNGRRVSAIAALAGTAHRPLLAVADSSGLVELWDPASGLTADEVSAGSGTTVLAALPVYAEAEEVQTAPASGAPVAVFPTETIRGAVREAAVLPVDGRSRLVSVHRNDLYLSEFDSRLNPCAVAAIAEFGNEVTAMEYFVNHEGSSHVAVAEGRVVHIYDLGSRVWYPTVLAGMKQVAVLASWVRDEESFVLAAGRGNYIQVWGYRWEAALRCALPTGGTPVRAMTALPGDILMVAGDDQTLTLWHLPTRRQLDVIHLDITVNALAPTPAGVAIATDAGVLEVEVHEL
ncbi:hypothetical protein [Kibdelosporangium phytohabitans]|uniref:Nephrocystin 3-like N-terminal domain-containing protein n=1 Tax=Kibdelosporangium phytohabitans TaxID=860235 RepID=A0A0N9HYE2_9PSEU|nr:hypothetical protein [Kibdelosporangium phytohabitans]ALG10526.1 hypothetical protein AOZ06_29785 [Kibdelosporangium phytohabitans]MBE1461623.1 WD40 repeat protein [Kibdelosporangium phytohabitans]